MFLRDMKKIIFACVIFFNVAFVLVGCNRGKESAETAQTETVEVIAEETADGNTFVDSRDGQVYRHVVMPDGKTWMAQNLNFATDEGSWCYDNDESNCEIYGRLYDWNTAITVCPAGWRLPSDEDWTTLENAVGGSATAAEKLKSQSGWTEYGRTEYGNGTDDFGFSALPGGLTWEGSFRNVGRGGHWWTNTENDATSARNRFMGITSGDGVRSGWTDKPVGLSVRCVRDD